MADADRRNHDLTRFSLFQFCPVSRESFSGDACILNLCRPDGHPVISFPEGKNKPNSKVGDFIYLGGDISYWRLK